MLSLSTFAVLLAATNHATLASYTPSPAQFGEITILAANDLRSEIVNPAAFKAILTPHSE